MPMVGVIAMFLAAGVLFSAITPPPTRVSAEATGTPVPAPRTDATAGQSAEPLADTTRTPYFAAFRDQRLRLPVPADRVTVLAFHQSSTDGALPMSSLLSKADLGATARNATRRRAARAAAAAPKAAATGAVGATATAAASSSVAPTAPALVNAEGIFSGKALTLWRSGRTSQQLTAIDCGARPGTPVYSPVDGTVMEIRPYKLYNKYPDFEIHIKPDAWSDVDVVIIHVDMPAVSEGQHVIAGRDRIAQVRSLAGKVPGLQLTEYTAEGGNHCHMQINRIPRPGDAWLLGQDPPGTIRLTP